MTVALYALAAAMMIGGIASVIQGFPFVRLESGLAMVTAGATVAAAGAVLLGLAAAVSALRRVEQALSFRRLAEEARPPVPASLVPPAATLPFPAPPEPQGRTAEPALGAGALGAGAIGALAGAGAAGIGLRRSEPSFESALLAAADNGPASDPTPEDRDEPERPLPPPARDETPIDLAPEDELFVSPEPAPPARPEETATAEPIAGPGPEETLRDEAAAEAPVAPAAEETPLRPALATEEPLPAPEETAPEPEAAPAAREVVGTYASGGNTYVMFSDGVIEAETPRGRYTFGSLDELKAFVAAGGEADRGAA
ncbi:MULTISPECIES: hypothetical protein [Methylobacterium]|uniref:Uncharacterized protein n=1 Tax=Methylobacterium jeotgali TaxID=381630 RepID=A0ABQ4SZT4_9HYPH|nr:MULTISPECIES: hypothetical protein [Methylobacterium]PIU06754.1 MAG: hypothetical protein COT56_08090 [Methylobacterium sp. CG09_land_8_20_14_0_10_71_15]PIU14858.1 MAG: hypothetical protein COT28_06475 [Methylobacterium sp. CG08_land_8_20_14_0_20_71_15]GBU17986.1 hypothetical protein AwMethylo_22010 [Methylobacterium sp.]GJE07443.1 hypothetical protein AOPFMNJM_2772 [Methylobacterium jeotgali]